MALSIGFEFVKIISSSSLKKKKLKLPSRVVRQYGGMLPNSILLKPRNGVEWRIGLEKSDDGKVWLQQHWPEFASNFSLGVGFVLIFIHEGNSRFRLSICDPSASDIDCPPAPPAYTKEYVVNWNPKSPKNDEPKDDSDYIQFLEYCQSVYSEEESLTPSTPVYTAESRINCNSKVPKNGQPEDDDDDDYDDYLLIYDSSSVHFNSDEEHVPPYPSNKRMRTEGDKFGMQPPDKVVEKKPQHCRGKVNDKKGKFSKFESVNRSAARKRTRRTYRDSEAFRASERFYSINPYFRVIVRPMSCVKVLDSFAMRHLKEQNQTVALKVGNDSWPVESKCWNSGHFLCGGLRTFLKENSLVEGDVCMFELIEGGDQSQVVLKVTIFRCHDPRS